MQRHWRTLELDGQALLFDRLTGTNVLLENEQTKSLRRQAPRMLQVALTNVCNKACSFCYRPLEAASRFTFDDLVDLAKFCDGWGVLELAFGGGEPTMFPRFAELLRTIWSQTGLCANFTTNGLRLKQSGLLREIRGAYGQVQLSVYDEDDTPGLIDHLVEERARFGLNYLVTPARVRSLEADVFTFLDRGARDILFLSYKETGFEVSFPAAPKRTATPLANGANTTVWLWQTPSLAFAIEATFAPHLAEALATHRFDIFAPVVKALSAGRTVEKSEQVEFLGKPALRVLIMGGTPAATIEVIIVDDHDTVYSLRAVSTLAAEHVPHADFERFFSGFSLPK